MSQADVIKVSNQTVGIVVREERGFRFFSSERTFDSLDGGHFALRTQRSGRRGRLSSGAPATAAFSLGL
ncbi:hypothetical protein [Bradyrhizobium sp. LMTR 3]|uniref:hypothetical protein n=1 Tax=Bradyrhizobium sp. LMTR 3 TaxID=189873 RepID=UPI0008104F8F|nr:hypothetical protein [Bradyrhizobium sp. LMTR 3]OCK59913.1 hypothetical protein LMTR3_20075 [Bradyrhizobium sp. LMTR 3]